MARRRLEIDEIKVGGRTNFPSNDNEFEFRLSNIRDIPKLQELRDLLQDKDALCLAHRLLKLSTENELECADGTFSLVNLQPLTTAF